MTDQGTGFRLEDVPDPREDENVLGDSGRGVLLMKAFMDEFDVLVSAAGGAEVVMAKRHRRQTRLVERSALMARSPAKTIRDERLAMSFKAASREIGGVTVIDMDGRITLGEGSDLLRDLIREKLDAGHKKIVMNLAGINYIDSTALANW